MVIDPARKIQAIFFLLDCEVEFALCAGQWLTATTFFHFFFFVRATEPQCCGYASRCVRSHAGLLRNALKLLIAAKRGCDIYIALASDQNSCFYFFSTHTNTSVSPYIWLNLLHIARLILYQRHSSGIQLEHTFSISPLSLSDILQPALSDLSSPQPALSDFLYPSIETT